MVPLQKSFECGLRSALGEPTGGEIAALAEARAKLPTGFGGLGVAQQGFAAQATYWAAYDMDTAVLPKLCEQPRHLQEEEHLDERAANDAKCAPLLSGVAVDKQSRVQIESTCKESMRGEPVERGQGCR